MNNNKKFEKILEELKQLRTQMALAHGAMLQALGDEGQKVEVPKQEAPLKD